MAIDLVIEWEGLSSPAYARRFRSAAAIRDFSPALRDIATQAIAPAITRNFAEQGRPKWAPLSEETIRTRLAEGTWPGKILIRTGALMEEATNPANYHIDHDSIEAEPAAVEYWIYHQLGTIQMPQRIIMNLQRGDQRRIGGIFDRFIKDWLKKNGLTERGQVIRVGSVF